MQRIKLKAILRRLQWPGSNYYPPMKPWPCFTHMWRKSSRLKSSALAITWQCLHSIHHEARAKPHNTKECGGSGERIVTEDEILRISCNNQSSFRIPASASSRVANSLSFPTASLTRASHQVWNSWGGYHKAHAAPKTAAYSRNTGEPQTQQELGVNSDPAFHGDTPRHRGTRWQERSLKQTTAPQSSILK